MFSDFLTNADTYAKLEQFWIETFREVCSDPGWKYPWVGTGHPSIKDGNPIFSAFSKLQNFGIRIIQQEEDCDYNDGMVYWVKDDEVIIAIVLTDTSLAECRGLLRRFCHRIRFGSQYIEYKPPCGKNWLLPTFQEISELGDLEKGWDSYGGYPIDIECATKVVNFLIHFADCHEHINLPQVVPCPSGLIQLEWHINGIDLEIKFGRSPNHGSADDRIEMLLDGPTSSLSSSVFNIMQFF